MEGYLKPYDIARLCTDAPLTIGRDAYTVPCPAHQDATSSLRVSIGRRATVMFCHAGCSLDDILIELEVPMVKLYHDYNKGMHTNQDSDTRLAGMMKGRRPHTMLELDPHESLYDVLYAVLKVSAEVWATVYLRWESELVKPFPEQFDQRKMLDAILLDLLEDHRDLGYEFTPQRRVILLTKLQNEWAKGKSHE